MEYYNDLLPSTARVAVAVSRTAPNRKEFMMRRVSRHTRARPAVYVPTQPEGYQMPPVDASGSTLWPDKQTYVVTHSLKFSIRSNVCFRRRDCCNKPVLAQPVSTGRCNRHATWVEHGTLEHRGQMTAKPMRKPVRHAHM